MRYRSQFFEATVYAKQQPLPLVGDEHYPDGSVGITFKPTPSMTHGELQTLIEDLIRVSAMLRRSE